MMPPAANTPEEVQLVHDAMSAGKKQQFTMLTQGLRKSLSNELLASLSNAIASGKASNTAVGIIAWVLSWRKMLGSAQEVKAQATFDKLHWCESKEKDLTSFAANLHALAAQFGDAVPEGLPREVKVRNKLLQEIGPTATRGLS